LAYRILDLFDTAGFILPCLKYLRSWGHTVDVLKRDDSRLHFMEHYKEPGLIPITKGNDFQRRVYELAKKADIIHVSYSRMWVGNMRHHFPNKKIVYQLHGGETRNRPELCQTACDMADMVLYTTTDLAKYVHHERMFHLPHAVDTDHFAPRRITSKKKLCMYNPLKPNLLSAARQYLHDIDGVEFYPLYTMPFSKVPDFLSNYGYYYDCKFTNHGQIVHESKGDTLSRMSQEALSLGLTVIDAGFKVHKGLPGYNRAENVAMKLIEYYDLMFEGNS
jgi:hypothetical protein